MYIIATVYMSKHASSFYNKSELKDPVDSLLALAELMAELQVHTRAA